LLIVAVLLLALYVIPALFRTLKHLDGGARQRLARGGWFLLGIVALVAIFARFGFHWLAVAGAATLAALRWAVPLAIRMWPLAQRVRNERARRGSNGSESGDFPGARTSRPRAGMARSEALEVLGLEEGASRQEILLAYRSLIQKVHPDHPGGSEYLASKLNQAKDILLG
jgi:hypothetical protein